MRLALIALALLAACAPDAGGDVSREVPVYDGITTHLLDGDLVRFDVTMRGAAADADVIRYAQCAAAQYALIRGYGFARHVRTLVTETAGIWRADAVYTISPALPRGSRTIDAEVVTADCRRSGIPTV